jgi:transcriptional regulator GlxA family with amidase domain
MAAIAPGGDLTTVNTPRRVGFLAFDGMQALDLVGPADAFGSDAFQAAHGNAGDAFVAPYQVVVIGLTGKQITSSSGLVLHATVGPDTRVQLDTLIIPGGSGLREGGLDRKAAAWIRERAPNIRRIASVCTGLYALAPTGLVDGCAVTTHWSAARDIAARYPRIDVQADAIFLRAGKYYTSAGISAGIDLALAFIEEDLGPQAALAVAREMVVYVKRSGGQNQFSEPLAFQLQAADRFKDLAAWIHAHLRADLSIEALAARTHLSARQFSRAFKIEFGVTPAAFVESARLAEASRRLASVSRRVDVASIARSVGYASDDAFRRAFERRFGVPPSTYRTHFRGSSR